jgi:thiol-disulfide isomerase/thioredoxin
VSWTSRLALLALGLLVACAGRPPVKSVVSLARLDCADCGVELAKALSGQPGVERTHFDRRRAEVKVLASPEVDVLALARSLSKGEEFELVPGEGKGSYLPPPPIPDGLDVAWIAKDGVDVADLASHRAAGKVTVMEFGAAWCEPCKKVDEHMVSILQKRGDVAYRKLDIGDWDTPLAKHYLEGAPALPFLVVFGKDGARVDAFGKLDLARLDRAIAKGAGE